MAPKIGASYVGVLPNSSRPVHPIPQSGCSSIVHDAGGMLWFTVMIFNV
jgi:hypothetical protein